MSTPEFKVGDWAYECLNLGQVMAIKDGRVTEFSDGYSRTSGWGLTCYPLTMRNHVLTEEYRNRLKRLGEAAGGRLSSETHRRLRQGWGQVLSGERDDKAELEWFRSMEAHLKESTQKLKQLEAA